MTRTQDNDKKNICIQVRTTWQVVLALWYLWTTITSLYREEYVCIYLYAYSRYYRRFCSRLAMLLWSWYRAASRANKDTKNFILFWANAKAVGQFRIKTYTPNKNGGLKNARRIWLLSKLWLHLAIWRGWHLLLLRGVKKGGW